MVKKKAKAKKGRAAKKRPAKKVKTKKKKTAKKKTVKKKVKKKAVKKKMKKKAAKKKKVVKKKAVKKAKRKAVKRKKTAKKKAGARKAKAVKKKKKPAKRKAEKMAEAVKPKRIIDPSLLPQKLDLPIDVPGEKTSERPPYPLPEDIKKPYEEVAEGKKVEKKSDNIYDDEERDEMLKEESLKDYEQGFMEGQDSHELIQCDNCGKSVDLAHVIEWEIEGTSLWFCSTPCLEAYLKKRKEAMAPEEAPGKASEEEEFEY